MIQIYHSSRCTKSRECLAIIEKTGQEFQVINYLKNVPLYEELIAILEKLDMQPIALVRTKEKIWIENFKNKTMTSDEIIQAMVTNPILIERPIIINGDKAIIGREFEKIVAFV